MVAGWDSVEASSGTLTCWGIAFRCGSTTAAAATDRVTRTVETKPMLLSIASRRMVGMNSKGVIVIVVNSTPVLTGPSPKRPA